MDPRISRWAKTLVGYCLDVQPGQVVLIASTPLAEPLILATYREVLRAGGRVSVVEVGGTRPANTRALPLGEPAEHALVRWLPRLCFQTMDDQ